MTTQGYAIGGIAAIIAAFAAVAAYMDYAPILILPAILVLATGAALTYAARPR